MYYSSKTTLLCFVTICLLQNSVDGKNCIAIKPKSNSTTVFGRVVKLSALRNSNSKCMCVKERTDSKNLCVAFFDALNTTNSKQLGHLCVVDIGENDEPPQILTNSNIVALCIAIFAFVGCVIYFRRRKDEQVINRLISRK